MLGQYRLNNLAVKCIFLSVESINNTRSESFATLCIHLGCAWQRHFFNRLTRGFFNITQHALFTTTYKYNRFTFTTGTASTTNTVNVRLCILWNVVVDNVADAFNVKTTSGNVGRHNHVELACFQLFNSAFTLLLRNVAVQRRTTEAVRSHKVSHFFRCLLGAHENHHGIKVFGFGDTQQCVVLMYTTYKPVTLTDTVIGGCL